MTDLRTIRHRLGLSQSEMARALRYSGAHAKQQIHRYETGAREMTPQLRLLLAMIDRFGLPEDLRR